MTGARLCDFDGDGLLDVGVWRPSTGEWWTVDSSTGEQHTTVWGEPGDVPVPADYDGDGRADIAVWRPSTGTWWIIDSSTGSQRTHGWGEAGDVPVPGDWSGDGRADAAVWRPDPGEWWLPGRTVRWGQPGDIPVSADFDGDGLLDVGVWRPSTGEWWTVDSSTGEQHTTVWGEPGDVPVPADYDGDGRADIAVWRPSTGTWWIIDSSTGSQRTHGWGEAGDVPVPGDWSGDGRADAAVWRPDPGEWWLPGRTVRWGQPGDIPVSAPPAAPAVDLAGSQFTWKDLDGTARRTTMRLTPGDPGKPLVVLLHGNGGSEHDLSAPATAPGFNHDYRQSFPPPQDVGWHAYPGIGIWSFELDGLKDVLSWETALNQRGYRTVTYSQVDPRGLLARPVVQLGGLVNDLLARFPDTSLAFLAHSRGGLLVRKYLKDHAEPALEGRVTNVITLHSPHQGSDLANLALAVNTTIAQWRAHFGPAVDSALGWLVDEVSAPSYQELSVGGSFLTDLARDEAPFPGARYHTFGGTSPLFTRLLWWVFTADSLVPYWRWPPFHWTIAKDEVPLNSPLLDAFPNLAPEVTEGAGDGLVANARARLPSTPHTTLALNHAEALWDHGLQERVLPLLDVRNAAFVSHSAPATMMVGQAVDVAVTMRNTGPLAWETGSYTLGALDGAVWGVDEVALPVRAAPGAEVSFRFRITAPVQAGVFGFQWQMMQGPSDRFGATSPPTSIGVAAPGEHPECPGLRHEVAVSEAEIASLQADLAGASPGQKAAIAAAIKRWQTVLARAEQRAAALACPPG